MREREGERDRYRDGQRDTKRNIEVVGKSGSASTNRLAQLVSERHRQTNRHTDRQTETEKGR